MTNPTSCRLGAVGLLRKPGRTVATIAAGLVLAVTPVMIVPGAAATDTAGRAADQVSTEEEALIYYYIKPVHTSGKCLTVHQFSEDPNATIRQYDCKGQQNQQFRMRTSSIAFYNELIARHSQMCITVHRSSKADGALITQYECVGQHNQHFLADPSRAGGTNIIAMHTLPEKKCLNVKGASKDNNAYIILWPCSDALNSKFRFVRV